MQLLTHSGHRLPFICMLRSFQVCVVLSGLVPAIALCDWPPLLTEYKNHLQANRGEIDTLCDSLLETDYGGVSTLGQDAAEASIYEDGNLQPRFARVSTEWRRSLDAVGVSGVSRCEFGVCVSFGVSPFTGNRDGIFLYVRGDDPFDDSESCEAHHELEAEGNCMFHLADDWWAYYSWWADED